MYPTNEFVGFRKMIKVVIEDGEVKETKMRMATKEEKESRLSELKEQEEREYIENKDW